MSLRPSPAAGTFTVSGRFQGLDTVGTSSDVVVRHNSATLLSAAVSGYGAQAPFSAAVTVAAGDTIEFSAGWGANASYGNDSTGLSASIVPAGAGGGARWLVADHLGTPRMVIDQTGGLSGVARHDYLPFGEELAAGMGGRTQGLGYAAGGVRQKFTGYERDGETGLDYAQARYFSPAAGRFTSVDPLLESAVLTIPQSWNRYSYVLNNPLSLTDPTGQIWVKDSNNNRMWIPYEQYRDVYMELKDEFGGQVYTPLTEEEMEYDSVNGRRVRLDPNGLSEDNPQGWSYAGPNHGSGAQAALGMAGVAAIGDGPEPGPGDIIALGFVGTSLYAYLTYEPLLSPLIFSEDENGKKDGSPSTPSPKDEKTADEQISGGLKASPSYHSELGGETKSSLEKMAKQKGEQGRRAKQMLKLIKEGTRLRGKSNKK